MPGRRVPARIPEGAKVARYTKRQRAGGRVEPYLFVAPIVILSGLVLYYSIAFTVRISLSEWNGLDPTMTFVGLRNFADLLSDRVLGISLLNNLCFMVFTVAIQAAIGLLVATLLVSKPRFSSLFKGIFFMPVVMAPIIIAAIFRIMMDANLGSINGILRSVGLGFMAAPWLGDSRFALASIIVVNVFEWMGFSMILYYAGLLAIPKEIYESATVDGAGFWKTFRSITLPLVRGTTSTLIVLGIIGSLKTFDIVYLLTNGGPGVSTEFLTTFLYKRQFEEFKSGSAAAIGVVILVLALLMSIAQIKSYSRSLNERQ